jgi:hypothetical protein
MGFAPRALAGVEMGVERTEHRTVDLTLVLHEDKPNARAVLVSASGDPDAAVWLPRSQITIAHDNAATGMATITCPTWLAIQRGLVKS